MEYKEKRNFSISQGPDCSSSFCYEIASEYRCLKGLPIYSGECRMMKALWADLQHTGNIPRKFQKINIGNTEPFNSELKDYIQNMKEKIKKGSGLIFQGQVGTGKTTQAILILSAALSHGFLAAYFLPFLSDFVVKLDSFNTKEEKFAFIGYLQRTPLLVVDDFFLDNISPANEAIFWAIITKRFDNEKSTIFTMNLSKNDTFAIPANIKDRLSSTCKIIDMRGVSRRGKEF